MIINVFAELRTPRNSNNLLAVFNSPDDGTGTPMGYHNIASIHMMAEGITIKKCLVFQILRNVSARTRLGKSTTPVNSIRNKSVYRPD